jgi:hypothetical protein
METRRVRESLNRLMNLMAFSCSAQESRSIRAYTELNEGGEHARDLLDALILIY